ncbi:MAG: DUF2304 domain-containing protein [Candidatus Nanopelagicales bacterium]
MTAQVSLVVAAGLLLVLVVELMRRQRLREKYAALWLLVSVAVLFFAIFPRLFTGISRLLGFGLPVNLAFALAVFVLLAVAMQLSFETGRLEDRVQRLAEEVALLRADLPVAPPPDAPEGQDRPGAVE